MARTAVIRSITLMQKAEAKRQSPRVASRGTAFPCRRRAFTLLEMLLAVTILGILATVAVTAARSANPHSIESAARILAADLRLARGSAIQYNTEWSVSFDLRRNRYELIHTGTGSPPPLVNPLASPSDQNGLYRVELAGLGGNVNSGNTVTLLRVMLSDSLSDVTDVTFVPLGGTGPARSEDTVIWLAQGAGKDMRCVRLTVSWVTGQVWISDPEMFGGFKTAVAR